MLCSVVALLSGCDSIRQGDHTAIVRDSAGVRITELPGPGLTSSLPEWRIGSEPSLEIGVREGDEAFQFSGIVGVLTLSDGRIVVLEGRGASRETSLLRPGWRTSQDCWRGWRRPGGVPVACGAPETPG